MTSGPGLHEPVPLLLQRVLRRLVHDHARAEPRRTAPVVLHAGMPGGQVRRFSCEDGEVLDHALRVEVLEAIVRADLQRGVVPLLWVTRPTSGPDDEDLAWGAACGAAAGELGVRLDLVVVTKRSWCDPRSGTGRSWSRVRQRG